jgi:hypothetical protein
MVLFQGFEFIRMEGFDHVVRAGANQPCLWNRKSLPLLSGVDFVMAETGSVDVQPYARVIRSDFLRWLELGHPVTQSGGKMEKGW